MLLNGLKDGDSQLCNKANVQVVITRTLAEAEELGTALPRWFFSYLISIASIEMSRRAID